MCDQDVIVDCDNCPHDHICCRGLRVKLEKDEIEQYNKQTALWDRKDTAIVAHVNKVCCYFDPKSRKCTIWERRPRMCRDYDCNKDKRIEEIKTRDMIPPIMRDNQTFKVYVSVIAVDDIDERKMSPMMLYSKAGPMAAETFVVRGNGKPLVESAKRQIERMIKDQLQGVLNEDDTDSKD